MNQFQLLTRCLYANRAKFLITNARVVQSCGFSNKSNDGKSSSSSSSDSSSSSSTSDDEQKSLHKEGDKKKHSEEALKKLNQLLLNMSKEDVPAKVGSAPIKVDLAKPKDWRSKGRVEAEEKKLKSPVKQMDNAIKDVANSLGGDVKQTESELLLKLLDAKTNSANLSELVKGLKIETDTKTKSRAQEVRQLMKHRTRTEFVPRERRQFNQMEKIDGDIDLFGSEPLGIFTSDVDATEGVVNKTWQYLQEREMKLAVTHPPANYFQEMILWTEQGKIWKFPIDNEQGLEEEAKVDFTEHVFLEKYLEPWCPPKGPIRHFMELVCVGLSKNPYLTVEAKKEHIYWYQSYFQKKKALLQETNALQGHDLSAGSPQIEN